MANVAFLGTGMMGSGMVEAMLRRGDAVVVWNRTESKARALEPLGARVAASPADAVAAADRVHLMLPDDAIVDRVLEQSLPRVRRDAVGLMMVSGPQKIYDAVSAVLQKMTGEVWYLGERPDLAAAYKLFGNSMLFVITGGIADVFAMAKANDIEPADALSVFSKFPVANVIKFRGEKMAKRDFSATFELTMARKDARLMLEAADGQPLTVLPGVAKRMDDAIANGHGKEDLGAIAAEVLR
jgi:3-hydroxyisobutyrate dehydrogenase-like beta-hydroxyacid dehydrogenase